MTPQRHNFLSSHQIPYFTSAILKEREKGREGGRKEGEKNLLFSQNKKLHSHKFMKQPIQHSRHWTKMAEFHRSQRPHINITSPSAKLLADSFLPLMPPPKSMLNSASGSVPSQSAHREYVKNQVGTAPCLKCHHT